MWKITKFFFDLKLFNYDNFFISEARNTLVTFAGDTKN